MKYFLNSKIALALLLLTATSANAQNLPNVQSVSLRAPSNVKTDGKNVEWGGEFKAYNHATNLFYTISNDDNNLYLMIQARDPAIIKKIIIAGIVLTINSPTKKNNKENSKISFPSAFRLSTTLISNVNSITNIKDNPESAKKTIDSLVTVMNATLDQKFKEIKVAGINAISDTLISVYNEFGIKAMARFDNTKAYTCELAIPLKYIVSADKPFEINYNIKAEGMVTKNPNIVFIEESDYMRTVNYATDFSGTYTLAK